jgi:hypothetical protein
MKNTWIALGIGAVLSGCGVTNLDAENVAESSSAISGSCNPVGRAALDWEAANLHDPSPGYGCWSDLCGSFVYNAAASTGYVPDWLNAAANTADDMMHNAMNAGVFHNYDGGCPCGAILFFKANSNNSGFGHVVMCNGDGTVSSSGWPGWPGSGQCGFNGNTHTDLSWLAQAENESPTGYVLYGTDTTPGWRQRIVVAPNADGRLQLFWAAAGSSWLYDNAQTSPGLGWAGAAQLGGAAADLSVVSNTDGRLELFYVGTDSAIYHNWQNTPGGAWHGQAPLGGSAKQLTAVANADGRLEVFYVGTNDYIFHNYQSTPGGAWHGEAAMGGGAKQIVAAVNQNGATEIFYIGTDDRLYHRWFSGGWSAEAAMGGAARQLAVTRNSDGRLEIFYAGTDDGIYHNWQNAPGAAWHGEASMGGRAEQLAVGQNADGRAELFYIGTNDALYHRWFGSAGWSGEASMGGAAKQIAVARNTDGRLELFYLGTNDALYHNWQNSPGSAWHGQAGF